MRLQKESDGWWIIEIPDTVTENGPYDTKAEAADDIRGLERSFRYEDDPEFALGEQSARAWRETKANPNED